MLRLILTVVSYGAFLLLVMPATRAGFALTAVLIIAGIWLMVRKRTEIAARKNGKPLLILLAAIMVYAQKTDFIYRWTEYYKYSYRMHALEAMLGIPFESLLNVCWLVISVVSVYIVYASLQVIIKKLNEPGRDFAKALIFCVAAAAVTVLSGQYMFGIGMTDYAVSNFIWSILTVLAVILFVYFLSGRLVPAVTVGTALFAIISTANVYVYQFRDRLLEPVDIFSARTAMNVMGSYSLFPVPTSLLIGWGFFLVIPIVLCCVRDKSRMKLSVKKRCAVLAACAAISTGVFFYTSGLKTAHWQADGMCSPGFILNFVSGFKEISAQEPDNYSAELIDSLAARYAEDENDADAEPTELPHIIVIMDEAFSDLSVAGGFSTNTEVMPFISSLKENTISGYALASVYGGNTANSEYELLTGNSLAWLSPSCVPYQQYVDASTYSMVSYLKSLYGYRCVAMHPYFSSGWNRPAAYECLGFDECHFVEDFPQENFVRDQVSDREMFEFLINTWEEQKENPLFILGVTMQNHGGYNYSGENYEQSITVSGHEGEYPQTEQYLSLIHETDKAVEYLVSYFRDADEKVIIVFYGDHQPKIESEFYDAIGSGQDTLDERQKRYEVPFFIWANYDIEEEYVDCTSLNFLSSYVYDAAGLTMPAYNRFLRELEEIVPAVNAYGYYSKTAGCYLDVDEADGDERDWLELYEILQYNSLFDKNGRSEAFFPALQ